MDLPLACSAAAQVGPINGRAVIEVLSSGRGSAPRVVVGDNSGRLSAYRVRGAELRADRALGNLPGPVSCLSLGSGGSDGRVFASDGRSVYGWRKGRLLTEAPLPTAERARFLQVEGGLVFAAHEHVCGVHRAAQGAAGELEEVASRVLEDRILAMRSFRTPQGRWRSALGCEDRAIRVVEGKELRAEHFLPSPCAALQQRRTGGAGELGAVRVLEDGCERLPGSFAGRSGIVALRCHDMTGDGVEDAVVAREDGAIEVHGAGAAGGSFSLRGAVATGETVRGVACGAAAPGERPVVLAAGCSGRVLRAAPAPAPGGGGGGDAAGAAEGVRGELERLRVRVRAAREGLRRRGEPARGAASAPAEDAAVLWGVRRSADDAACVLAVELPCAIEGVVMKSPVRLEVLGVDEGGGGGGGGGGGAAEGAGSLWAYRCRSAARRVEVKFRSAEGDGGEMFVTVVACREPKAAQVLRVPLKPLSMHRRTAPPAAPAAGGPQRHGLRIRGSFSARRFHGWVDACLPEVPARPRAPQAWLAFEGAFHGAQLLLRYADGEAAVEADSASALAVLRDHIGRHAARERVAISEELRASRAALLRSLKLLRPGLEGQRTLSRRAGRVAAVAELRAAEPGGAPWMDRECREIHEGAAAIAAAMRSRPGVLAHLCGVLSRLLVDMGRLQGRDDAARAAALRRAVMRGASFEEIGAAFGFAAEEL